MKRELNEIEYFNWCVAQPYNMVVAVQVRGGLRAERLREALDKAQRRHPLLAVNTEPGPNGLPWFSSEGVGPIPLTTVFEADPGAAHELFERELSATFVRDQARTESDAGPRLPLLRVTLFLPRDATAPADLVFTVQHVIADGLSMVYLVRDLLRFMEAPSAPVDVCDAPASPAELLPTSVRRHIPRSSLLFRCVLRLVKIYAWLRFRPHPATAGQRHQHHRSWELTEGQTSRFRARCKLEQVSVHAAVCTAFSPAFGTIHSPVSLRERLARPVGESVGLFIGAAEIKLKYRAARGYWNNARAFNRRLRKALRNPFGIFRLFSKAVPVALVQQLGPLLVRVMSDEQPFAITNLGELDGRGLRIQGETLRLDAFYGAVTGIVDSSVLTVYTLEGRLRLHLLASETGSDTTVRDKAQGAVELLLAAI